MQSRFTRRTFLVGSATGITTLSTGWPLKRARAQASLNAVDWGTPYIEAARELASRFGKAEINWSLHDGGGAAILAKIKASWPNTQYDLIDNFTPVFLTMAREGWAETVTLENVPNLAKVPEGLISKDENGNWKSIPRSTTGACFAYNPDRAPIEIKSFQDLFDPRLKGQIVFPGPLMTGGLGFVALALANGGDEFNIDPGFAALADLAKTGNIGRVFTAYTDAVVSMTSGETSVAFGDQGILGPMTEGVKLTYVSKVTPELKTILFTEGWVIMSNSQNKELAFEFANFSISAEECAIWNKAVGLNPANIDSEPTPGLEHIALNPEEMSTYGYVPDYDHISQQLDGWSRRYETEIAPLLR